jgi:hypothetical protein
MKNKFKVPKTIKARNTWFNSLTKEEKRVAIAKDVIEQLDLQKFTAKSGTYFSLNLPDYKVVKEGVSLQKQFDKAETCKVCAMGAVFASKVRLGNEFEVPYSTCIVSIDDDYIVNSTDSLFSEYEMRLMEFFFEGADINETIYHESEDYDSIDEKVREFCDTYKTADERMRAIMQNIIDSEGAITL